MRRFGGIVRELSRFNKEIWRPLMDELHSIAALIASRTQSQDGFPGAIT